MNRPDYEALNHQGLPYLRPPRAVGELPSTQSRHEALVSATRLIGTILNINAGRCIPFGAPVFVAFGLTRAQAKIHPKAELLLTNGDSLPLEYCPEYN